jgi:hypothetical protein
MAASRRGYESDSYGLSSAEDWFNVLELATEWAPSVRALAIRRMEPLISHLPTVRHFVARKQAVESWVDEALLDLALRPAPLSDDEVRWMVDFLPTATASKDVALVSHLRECAVRPRTCVTREEMRERMRTWRERSERGAAEEVEARAERQARGRKRTVDTNLDAVDGTASTLLKEAGMASLSDDAASPKNSVAFPSSKSSIQSSAANMATEAAGLATAGEQSGMWRGVVGGS